MQKFIGVIIGSVFFFVGNLQIQAATYTICSSGCDYTDIQFGYNASSCGDAIIVNDSRNYDYANGLSLNKSCTATNAIIVSAGSGYSPSISRIAQGGWINMISVSGNYNILDGFAVGPQGRGNGVEITGAHNTIKNNRFDDICTEYIPSGSSCECLRINGGSDNIVQDNTYEDCNHSAICVEGLGGVMSQYNKILDNVIISRYGHGINIAGAGVQYNLFDGNKVSLCGTESDQSHQKSAVQFSGVSHNTLRRNVIYDINRRGIEISTYGAVGPVARDNWIYNNTFYNITTNVSGRASVASPNYNGANDFWVEISAGYGGINDVSNNKFYNNIADKVGQGLVVDDYVGGSFYGVWSLGYFFENDAGSNIEVVGNNFNDNILKNNIIRPYFNDQYHLNYDHSVYYMSAIPDWVGWTVSMINGKGLMSDNIAGDPLFFSTNTAIQNWWHLQPGSVAIDAGISINDPNGTVGGWSQLMYSGNAPDIGAYEYQETAVVIRADVDQSSSINSTDALLTLRNSLGLNMSSTNWQVSATTGDVNCDDSSSSTDALLILRESLGLDMSGTGWCG